MQRQLSEKSKANGALPAVPILCCSHVEQKLERTDFEKQTRSRIEAYEERQAADDQDFWTELKITMGVENPDQDGSDELGMAETFSKLKTRERELAMKLNDEKRG
jgi:hypothetical protein